MSPQRDTVHWYAGPNTFYRAPQCAASDLPEGSVAVLGVPLDSWTLGRNGQRYAPRALREASLYLAGYYGLQTEPAGYVDVRSGRVWTVPERPRLFDAGDVRLHQGDVHAQIEAIAAPVAEIVKRGAMPVVLGGDHFVPYPSFLGYVRGVQARTPGAKVGFLNIDGHLDFWDEFRDMGRYNHGTFARRISEHEAVGNMVWWGLNGANILEPEQLEICRERGFAAYTVSSIRRRGVQATIAEALEIASQGVDHLYVTFDIDATDGAFAPGTHSIVLDGLTAGEVLEALDVVAAHEPLGAFDVCEMIPQYDVGGGRTARYGATAVLAVVGRRVLDSTPRFDRETLDAVFR
ncbi:MAG TPA: agmatinase family protein [Solirubrobacteraceae bacterium]|jgi:agmatinase